MSYIYVCNTSSDYISKINLQSFNEEKKIKLSSKHKRVGPHGICRYNEKLLIANNYNNCISIIDMNSDNVIENHYIGVNCNDVKVWGDLAYIICGDCDNVVIFDLTKNKIIEHIPCGKLPHSIEMNENEALAVISNMNNDSITILDCKSNDIIANIRVGAYPTKSIFTPDGNYILVCESNLGMDAMGSVSLISLKELSLICRIKVGTEPLDICIENNLCYVSNFGSGSVTIIDLNSRKCIRDIFLVENPRGIIAKGQCLYVGDSYNDLLIKINMKDNKKKSIPVGREPTGMVLL